MINRKTNRTRGIKKTKFFLSKLYDILNDTEYKDIISWNIEGNGLIIKETTKLCKIVLPKFYKHNNYSSFVRQLNMYGFHKSQGILKDGEGFEHDIFCKTINKEQIKQIILNNRIQKITEYKNNNNQEESKIKDSFKNENNINEYMILYDKEKTNSNALNELKVEIKNLKKNNEILNDNLEEYKSLINGHCILFEKFIKRKKNINRKHLNKFKKIHNIKELFNKYLYYLHIYSPYVTLNKNNDIMDKHVETEEGKKTDNINYKTINEINSNINDNTESIFESISFLRLKRNIDNNELNLNNNISSSSSLFFRKDLNKY